MCVKGSAGGVLSRDDTSVLRYSTRFTQQGRGLPVMTGTTQSSDSFIKSYTDTINEHSLTMPSSSK